MSELEIVDFKDVDFAGLIESSDPWQPEPGKCYANLPNEVYHSLSEWNGSSMLKHGLRSAESWQYEKRQPHKRSLPLERGSALHVGMDGLIIGDDWQMFDEQVKTFDGKAIPSKKFLEAEAKYPSCIIVPRETKENVNIMADKSFKNASKLDLLSGGYSELSFFWIDEATGIKCKVRPDYFNPDLAFIVDYKTTKDHTEDGFPREINNFKYHFSAAFYMEGILKASGIEIEDGSAAPYSNFVIIAIANTPPFENEFYPLRYRTITQGRFLFRSVLDKIKKFDTKPRFTPIDIPMWAMTYIDKDM